MKHPDFCVWSGMLYIGKWAITNVPTACVKKNGNTQYGRAFIEGMQSDAEVNFVVLHEKGHVALMHTTRAQPLYKKHRMVAARAVDEVVNNLILDADPNGTFAKMPTFKDGPLKGKQMGYLDRRFQGKSLHEVFNTLMKEGPPPDIKHISFDDHEWEDGDDPEDALSEEEVEALEAEIGDALRTGSNLAGKLGGSRNRLVGELNEPTIDWREQMSEFVMEVCQGDGTVTWNRPVRRFIGEDLYLPSSIDESIGEIVWALDVSGSVGDDELRACLSEGVELCRVVRPSKFRLIYWSDGITREEIYGPEDYDNIISLTKPVGGGGTDIRDVAKHINALKDVQCCVIATDGDIYGGWGTWTVPTLWAVTNRRNISPVGKTIYLKV